MPSNSKQLSRIASNPVMFTRVLNNIQLRPYQVEPLTAILDSIFHHRGLSFVIIFSRQSGKDELIANLVVYLLARFRQHGGRIVCAQPTFKPQTITAMSRLEARLDRPWFRKLWKRCGGYVYRMGKAACVYFSAEPSAHVVGETATLALIINEAQDVEARIYDKSFAPMAAANNATKIFSGTRWTSNTLLERELHAAMLAEKVDGRRRVFIVDGETVGKCNAHYAGHLAAQIAAFGRQHPLIKTQYFCEAIDSQAGMFPPGRQSLMAGSHSPQIEPIPGKQYAFLVDVAGQEEWSGRLQAGIDPAGDRAASLWDTSRRQAVDLFANPGRDSTALKIVEIDPVTISTLGKPVYKVVHRQSWTGAKHVIVFGALRALAASWKPLRIVIDATGIGEGLWSLLDNAFGDPMVIPVKFSPAVKSELGYGFLGIVESGRYQEYSPFDDTFRKQLDHCIAEIIPGPAKLMRWSVPDGTRDQSGELIHDDDLVTSSMCHILDGLDWSIPTTPQIVPGVDPLESMDRSF